MDPVYLLYMVACLLCTALVIVGGYFTYQWYQKNAGILKGIAGEVEGAFDPKIPGKKPCPDGMRDDGTSCWKEDYGNGVGTIMAKRDCGEGLEDDGTSCWKVDKPIETQNAGYHDCPAGTKKGAFDEHCYGTGWEFATKKKDASERRYCAEGYNWDGALGKCVKNCPQGYYRNGLFCSPDGGAGIKTTLMERNYCPDGKVEVDGLCFTPCKPGYKFAGGSICVPEDGPAGIRVTAFDRYQCPPPDAPEYTVLSGALCYKPKA